MNTCNSCFSFSALACTSAVDFAIACSLASLSSFDSHPVKMSSAMTRNIPMSIVFFIVSPCLLFVGRVIVVSRRS